MSEVKLPKLHYFEEKKADPKDIFLNMSIKQGYVPKTCLLGGQLVWGLVSDHKDPCEGCRGPREICSGRPFFKIKKRKMKIVPIDIKKVPEIKIKRMFEIHKDHEHFTYGGKSK